TLDRRPLREDVARRKGDVALTRKPFHELPSDDLFDGAGGALDLDPVIPLQQRRDFLAGGAEEFRDFVDPNSCQSATSTFKVQNPSLLTALGPFLLVLRGLARRSSCIIGGVGRRLVCGRSGRSLGCRLKSLELRLNLAPLLFLALDVDAPSCQLR